MLQALLNVLKITELRNKILFTLGMLAVFRIGHWIPLPGVDQKIIVEHFRNQASSDSAVSRLADYIAIFSGGDFSRSTIFGLGIMPYISASIIFQLLASVWKKLKDLQQEGPSGRQKIMEWTRLATVALCIVQGLGWLKYITSQGLVYAEWASNPIWWIMAVCALTAGTVFLMWLGEQIDKYGIGNGTSLIIMAGILGQMPTALQWVVDNTPLRTLWVTRQILGNVESFEPSVKWLGLVTLVAGFIFVVAGAVLMTVAQRRIPIQQAKHMRGQKLYQGQRSFLPLRLNHGGVMPVIFASSLMIFPSTIFSMISQAINADPNAAGGFFANTFSWLAREFAIGEFPYTLCEFLLIYFFSYFWITVQFNPEEMSKQLRDHGSFIPGLRPGPRTAEYLETVMERITFVGAAFLGVIAVLPMVVNKSLKIDYSVTQFLGGTGLLIVVSVALDFVQRVEAHLLMRNYAGFLGGADDGKGPRIRGPRG